MNAIVIILAIIGLLLLILLAIGALTRETSTTTTEPDPATPYREGLHAAMRMQRVAQDLEQQLYTEAAKHLGAAGVQTQGHGSEPS